MINSQQNQNEVSINEDEINTHYFEFINCPTIELVIMSEEGEEVYIVDFETYKIGKSYYLGGGNAKIWRINEDWSKVKRRKMSKVSNAFFKVP